MRKEKFKYKKQSPSHEVKIYIAGNYDRIEQVCSDYVTEVGLCVNVKPTNFIYTHGEQSGAEIGLISYPKFKPSLSQTWEEAIELCEILMGECNQKSATVIDEGEAVYIERQES